MLKKNIGQIVLLVVVYIGAVALAAGIHKDSISDSVFNGATLTFVIAAIVCIPIFNYIKLRTKRRRTEKRNY